MGFLAKAASLREEKAPAAKTQESATPPEAPTAPRAAEKLAAASAEVSRISAGIDAPAALFGVLRRTLGLERAAILSPDPKRGIFSAWAATGFDKTSLRRLRIAGTEAAALRASTAEGESLAPWLRLFSTRDAPTIRRLRILPCLRDGAAMALLLIAEMDGELDAAPELEAGLGGILDAAATLLWERRESVFAAIAPAPAELTGSPVQVIGKALERANGGGGHAIVFRIGLKPVQECLRGIEPSVELFRLTEDVGTLLGSLTRDTAELALAPTPDGLLGAARGVRKPDAELWAHALLRALTAYLPALSRLEPPSLPVTTLSFPEDGATAAELIAALA